MINFDCHINISRYVTVIVCYFNSVISTLTVSAYYICDIDSMFDQHVIKWR